MTPPAPDEGAAPMRRYAMDLGVSHERASATPESAAPRRHAPAPREPSAVGGGDDTTLRGRQAWFARAVMGAATGDDEAARVLTAGPRSSPAERLDVYRRGYAARLIECLADDYPVLRHAIGADAFEDLCRAYMARYPSTGPSLNFFGRKMAELCKTRQASGDVPAAFCADLAALEWAVVEVIHAPSSEPLTLEALQRAPVDGPHGGAELRLVANTALRLLRLSYPVNTYLQAFREGRATSIPEARPSATVVYRSGPTVWRMDLTEPMFEVLAALLGGMALGEALGRADAGLAGLDEAQAAERVGGWFREWVASGLFVGVSAG